MYSFLSPQNINYLIFQLRQIHPEDRYEEIRYSTPSLANEWFRTGARVNENQFVYGTKGLNEAFIKWIIATRQFMEPLPDPLPSYSGDVRDPHIRNQKFDSVINGNIYPDQIFDYDIGQANYFTSIYRELEETDCCGIPVASNLPKTTLAELAMNVKRRRDGKSGRPVFTSTLKTCEGDSRSCEYVVRPRKRFYLSQNYETPDSNISSFYRQSGCYNPCNYTAAQLREQSRWYPNYRYPHKDMIPTKKSGQYSSGY